MNKGDGFRATPFSFYHTATYPVTLSRLSLPIDSRVCRFHFVCISSESQRSLRHITPKTLTHIIPARTLWPVGRRVRANEPVRPLWR